MSDKDRKKKDGQDTNKKNQRMHEAVAERHENVTEDGQQNARGRNNQHNASNRGPQ